MRRPSLITGIAIFVGLQGAITASVLFLEQFGVLASNDYHTTLTKHELIVFVFYALVSSSALSRASRWARHWFVIGGWLLVMLKGLFASDVDEVAVTIMSGIALYLPLTLYFYLSESVNRYFARHA